MGIYGGVNETRTAIRQRDGRTETDIWINRRIAAVVPTDPSQIRPKRISMLWKPKTKLEMTGKKEIKEKMLQPLGRKIPQEDMEAVQGE